MKLAEILKAQGLNDEQIQSVQNSMKENKIHTTSIENADERYNKLKTQKTELEGIVKERDTQLTELSKNNKDNNELLTQIKDLQALNKTQVSDYEGKINKMQFDYALDGALSTAKCKNNKAIKALLDMEGIKYQDGKIEGLETQLESLQKEASYLFDTEAKPSSTGSIGNFGRSGNQGEKDSFLEGFKNY